MRKVQKKPVTGPLAKMQPPSAARRGYRPVCLAALAGMLAWCQAAVVSAQQLERERASVSLGLFVADRSTTTRIDAEGGDPGSEVDLEKDLGLDSSNSVFRIDGYYKFNDRHRIDASWFDLSRSSTKTIDREIEWNGTIYPINATLNSIFDLNIYKLAYTYSFLRRDKGFMGASAGLYIADFATSLDAPALGEREVGDGTAPLPVFGLRGEYHFTDRWIFRASGEIFVFEYDNWDGSLYDLYAGIDYRLNQRFSIGAALNSVTFDLGVVKQNFTGNVDWGYTGGLVFVKLNF